MSLEEKFESDFKVSLKAKDRIKVSVLRMLKTEIQNTKISQKKNELTDQDIVKIVQRDVKQHKDSIEQFEKGSRTDLAEKEKKELEILLGYLPKQASDEELAKIVKDAVEELGASDKKMMGAVIKNVMEKVKGAADGKKVSQLVAQMITDADHR